MKNIRGGFFLILLSLCGLLLSGDMVFGAERAVQLTIPGCMT